MSKSSLRSPGGSGGRDRRPVSGGKESGTIRTCSDLMAVHSENEELRQENERLREALGMILGGAKRPELANPEYLSGIADQALVNANESPFRVPLVDCTCHHASGSFGCEVHGDA